MQLIDKEPIIEFIKKGLNNPNKEEAFGYDAIQILAEIAYAPTFESNTEKTQAKWKCWSCWDFDSDKQVDAAMCSKCGYVIKGKSLLLDDYCSNCNSKMIKE